MEENYDATNLQDVRVRSNIFLEYYKKHPNRLKDINNVNYFGSWLVANGGTSSFTDKKSLKSLIIDSLFYKLSFVESLLDSLLELDDFN